MKKVMMVFVVAFGGLWSLASAVIFSGTVTDSVSGKALGNVFVRGTTPPCTTFTDTNGNFSLNTAASSVTVPLGQRCASELSWSPGKGVFSWTKSAHDVSIMVRNLRGAEVARFYSKANSSASFAVLRLPQGMYVAQVTMAGRTSAFTILNLKSCSWNQTKTLDVVGGALQAGLDARAATQYSLTFEKAEYRANALSASGSQSNLHVKMRPLPAPAGMRHIVAGTFHMGSTTGYDDEQPVHTVTVSSFFIDTTDVTQADYLALMGSNPSAFGACARCPVEEVTWLDAILYCNARSKRDGLDTVYSFTSITKAPETGCSALDSLSTDLYRSGYRLPTEAQWEYACRAGSTTPYFWGSDTSADTMGAYSWYFMNAADSTHPVATKKPNAWRLYDMSGNVWQWCNDWFGTYTDSAQVDPTGPQTGDYQVVRGGSWVLMFGSFYLAGLRHSASRYGMDPGNWYNTRSWYTGFRCAR